MSYKRRLLLYFILIFSLFTIGIVIFEERSERNLRTWALTEKLDAYSDVVNSYIAAESLDSLNKILPDDLRVTVISRQGEVLFDNAVSHIEKLDNHYKRPEIVEAQENGLGYNIRKSDTKKIEYLYYAKKFNQHFVRVALPYDLKVRNFIKGDYLFLYFIGILFFVMLFFINLVADRFAKSIRKLKEFAMNQSDFKYRELEFPNDELGDIGRTILNNFQQIENKQNALNLEREKLLQHTQTSGEGLCFFSANKEIEFYNGLFIQYINIINEQPDSDPEVVFRDEAFKDVVEFIEKRGADDVFFETTIGKQGKIFNVNVNVFDDNGFEIIIDDISSSQKTQALKKEMTANVAHEIRTPVTSIRGYLEIALEQGTSEEKAKEFLNKAHQQTIILSDLISDMSLLTKMEENSDSFNKEKVKITDVVDDITAELSDILEERHINVEMKNMDNVVVDGNKSLIYSIFRNLTDNAIRYAGTDINITIQMLSDDKHFYYLSFADNGFGIKDESHLNRIFERFYRVNEGRSRQNGGSGLGLSIVKNAVVFHRGTIVAKNRKEGGLEFLFKLPK